MAVYCCIMGLSICFTICRMTGRSACCACPDQCTIFHRVRQSFSRSAAWSAFASYRRKTVLFPACAFIHAYAKEGRESILPDDIFQRTEKRTANRPFLFVFSFLFPFRTLCIAAADPNSCHPPQKRFHRHRTSSREFLHRR